MLVRRACSVLGAAAIATWVLHPAVAQEGSEAIPEELRIIDDLPDPAEARRSLEGVDPDLEERVDEVLNGEPRDGEPGEEGTATLDRDTGGLFDESRSLLYETPDDSPAERLLPDDVDPDIDLDPRSAGEDGLDPRSTGDDTMDDPIGRDSVRDGVSDPQDRISAPQDRIEPGGDGIGPETGGSAGGSSGGGSLF